VSEDSPIHPLPKSPNWFVRHWGGEASLGIAFWLNWLLIAHLLSNVLMVAYVLTNPLKQSLRTGDVTNLIVDAFK
jgi:hypothetical protein